MKKLNLLIGLLIGFIIISCSTDEQENEENISSGLLKRMEIQDNSVPYIYEFYYNPNNTISEIIFYNYFTLDTKNKFYYDNLGRLDYIESIIIQEGFNNAVDIVTHFDYNLSNQLVSEIKYNINDEVLERIDFFYENNNLSCMNRCYDNECNSFNQICFEFDVNENPITTIFKEDNGQTISQINISEFDNNKRAFFGSNLNEINHYTNSALGLIKSNHNSTNTQVTTYFPDGNINLQLEYDYEIDYNSSNMPTEIRTNLNQSLNSVIKYEYY